jgi:hypothetical protein
VPEPTGALSFYLQLLDYSESVRTPPRKKLPFQLPEDKKASFSTLFLTRQARSIIEVIL